MRDHVGMRSESVGVGGCTDVPAWLRERPMGRDCPPCEERAGGRPCPDDVRLSIAHTDSPPPAVPPNAFRYWPKASLAIIPAGENKSPNCSHAAPKRGVRGKITSLSRGARRRIVTYLSTIEAKAKGYTFSLTLPKDGETIPPDIIHRYFRSITTNYTASSQWAHVGAVHKREFQKRGALHYHFAFYGIRSDAEAIRLQRWFSEHWINLVCSRLPLKDPTRKKMMRVHMNPKNMERIRDTIASYFAKYLGKDEGAYPVEVPGKWWGKLNEKSIPVVEEKQLVVPCPVRDKARRWGSKLQSKRVQYGLYRSAMRNAGLIGLDGEPVMSLQQFNQARNPLPRHLAQDSLRGNLLWCYQQMRKRLLDSGYRPGSHNRPRPSKFGKITLIGSKMPGVAKCMIKHAAVLWREELENRPF